MVKFAKTEAHMTEDDELFAEIAAQADKAE
jgi:hypothetical protein